MNSCIKRTCWYPTSCMWHVCNTWGGKLAFSFSRRGNKWISDAVFFRQLVLRCRINVILGVLEGNGRNPTKLRCRYSCLGVLLEAETKLFAVIGDGGWLSKGLSLSFLKSSSQHCFATMPSRFSMAWTSLDGEQGGEGTSLGSITTGWSAKWIDQLIKKE